VVVVVVADEQMVTVAVAAVGIWLAEAAAVTVAMTAVVVGAEPAELFEERIVLLAVLFAVAVAVFRCVFTRARRCPKKLVNTKAASLWTQRSAADQGSPRCISQEMPLHLRKRSCRRVRS
jgi:hypothetical protein